MAKVYDPAQQATIDVPASEATAGIRAGKYLAAEKRVRITRDDGELGTIDATELGKALDSGFRVVDDDEVDTIRLRREAESTGGLIKGTAEAATAGVTLGLSTLLASQYNDPAAMAARREAVGTLGTVAEVGGAVLPALVTGGSTAAVRGGGLAAKALAATPSGFLARQAARAGEGLAAHMGTGAASKIVPIAGREFIEGAGQAVGAQIDEDVLGDRELAADRLASAGLMGGLFGVGAGVGVHGLAKVASGAVRAPIAGMQKVLGRGNAASGGLATREAAEIAVAEGKELSLLAKGWKKNAIMQGNDPETVQRLATLGDSREGRRELLRIKRDEAKIMREAAELVGPKISGVHADLREVAKYATGEAKVANWERKVGKSPEQMNAAIGETEELAKRARERMDALLVQNKLDSDKYGASVHNGAVLHAADQAIGRLHLRLAKADELTGAARVARRAAAVDMYKREIGGVVDANGGWGQASRASPETRNSINFLKDLYQDPRALLERVDIFDEAAAGQAAMNNAYSQVAMADDLFDEATRGTGLSTVLDPDGAVNAAKAIKLVRAHGRVGGDVIVQRLMDSLRARVRWMREVQRHVDVDDAGRARIASTEQAVDDLEREFKRQAKDAALLDDIKEMRRVSGDGSPSLLTTGTTLGGLLGFGAAGPLGAIGGAVLMAMRQPDTTLFRYAAIMDQLDKVDIRLDGVVSRMFGKAGELKLPKIDLPRLPTGAIAGQLSRKEHDERREKAIEKATDYIGSSEALAQALAVPLYDVPPGIASTIQERAQVAASFLQAKAPKVYKRGKTKLVDPVSSASFARYLEAVVDPIGALERFQSGRITAETAEAIRVVYPALFLDLQERIQTEMARALDEGREIPYDKRIRYGQLFATTTDPSLVPATAMEMQTAIGADFDEPTAAEVMAAGKTQKPGKIEPGGGTSMQTAGDRSANWRTTS